MSNATSKPSDNRQAIFEDAGRALPITKTSTPMPPVKPPKAEKSESETKK